MNEAAWLTIAFVLMLLAMSWFALSLKSHWKQVTDGKPASRIADIALALPFVFQYFPFFLLRFY